MRLIQYLKLRSTILLVHNFQPTWSLVKTVLEGDDYRILEVENGLVAVKIAYSNTRPDLIVIDISMPDMSGLETVRKLRAAGGDCRHVPILMLSSSDAKLKAAALDAGANAYFRIPEELEPLRLSVREMLSGGEPGI